MLCLGGVPIVSILNLALKFALSNVLGPPSSPPHLESSPLSLKTLLLSWSPSFSPFSVLVTYKVEVWEGEDHEVTSFNTNSTSVTYTSRSVSCSLLQIRVAASNQAGQSDYTSNITASIISCESVCVGDLFILLYVLLLFDAVTESEDVSNSFKEELELVSGDVFATLSFTVSKQNVIVIN